MTTYKVVGDTYAGHQQGDEFELDDLDPFLEEWAIEQKLIEVVGKTKSRKETAE